MFLQPCSIFVLGVYGSLHTIYMHTQLIPDRFCCDVELFIPTHFKSVTHFIQRQFYTRPKWVKCFRMFINQWFQLNKWTCNFGALYGKTMTILKTILCFTHQSKNLRDFFTQPYCHVFVQVLWYKSKQKGLLKIITLYQKSVKYRMYLVNADL